MPNCTRLTVRSGAFESLAAILPMFWILNSYIEFNLQRSKVYIIYEISINNSPGRIIKLLTLFDQWNELKKKSYKKLKKLERSRSKNNKQPTKQWMERIEELDSMIRRRACRSSVTKYDNAKLWVHGAMVNGGSRGRDLKEKSLYFQKNALCLA